MQNPLYATTGAAGGFSLTALLEWARNPSTVGAIVTLGSALSTALGWYLARRAEIARANLETEKERRAMEREQKFLDAIAGQAVLAARSRPPRIHETKA